MLTNAIANAGMRVRWNIWNLYIHLCWLTVEQQSIPALAIASAVGGKFIKTDLHMKKILTLIFLSSFTLISFGQNTKEDSLVSNLKICINNGINPDSVLSEKQLKFFLEKDTVIRISYIKEKKERKIPAYFVNGILVNPSLLSTIDINAIEDLNIKNDSIEIGGQKYYGQFHVKLKNNFSFKPISINDLKKKYLDLPEDKSIIMIDNKIVYDDYKDFVLNEIGIYKITIQLFENKEENLRFNIIKLITRSEKNIKEENMIHFR